MRRIPSGGGRHAARFVEQRVRVRAHHEQRHQVLEHRTAPAHERRGAARFRQQSAQGEPVLLAELVLGDRYEAAQTSFGCQQIVETVVETVVDDVVADREQFTRLVE
jgi:hypothetical protein